ncbi:MULTISPECIES: metallophosphoesterase [unclassified Arsukibacterium]|uniref:metallophosphoesterase n=1 Tax=unclassified Arsukibacterium TaxID=2635278 RepID=UPI000C48E19E|nr:MULTISPECIES: metallophosphoesterase [unclassified Arsukibacterium]MAA94699.1 3',5'-cyclic-nucleotide phosphodiesterase [Rheinheimera sp.]MBM33750.1 3',5'-cyclic-nucleotide phosphodiesterase [Rheinheimera sp.]HAW91466.1 3',5'-cyclic-nucleotide phosphodiesterase [Candidatus Azambacteria bacterium]|tara:strand:+ start:23648 stop:24415 length:768 start_codon:yes stop_codon:yes gene_type:complete
MAVLQLKAKAQYQIVQLSDCHLLADIDGEYQGVKSGRYLQQVIAAIVGSPCLPDAIILSGDLSQDHSRASYQLLARLLAPLTCPVLVLPGNHDDYEQLSWITGQAPLVAASSLQLGSWQLLLLDTKGETPAGYFDAERRRQLARQFAASNAEHLWLFSHHHPLPLGSAIDKHGWQDPEPFWQLLATEPRLKGLAHGHCHHAYAKQHQQIQLVGCPASSVQFCQDDAWQTHDKGPMYCHWQFAAKGQVSWQFITIS